MSLLRAGYYGLSWLAFPIVYGFLKYRLKQGKESSDRFYERFGFSNFEKKEEQTLVWFNAVSVGETLSVLPLIEALSQKYPFLSILLTTSTLTSLKVIEKKLPKRTIHQFVPVDTPQAVSRFLAHWQPDLAIWIESELWPNLLYKTQEQGIPTLLINGRLSEKSFRHWSYFSSLIQPLLKRLNFCSVQTIEQKKYFEALGVENAHVIPNLKIMGKPGYVNEESRRDFQKQFKNRPVWFAACTHKGEDEIAIKLHQALRKKIPNLLTILAPRHIERIEDIKQLLKNTSLTHIQRTSGDEVALETDVYLIDTVGELNLFYSLVSVVLLGATFVEKGGHNPIEAAQMGSFILHGGHIENNINLYKILHSLGLAYECKDIITLEKALLMHIKPCKENEVTEPEALQNLRKEGLKEIIGSLSPYINQLKKNAYHD